MRDLGDAWIHQRDECAGEQPIRRGEHHNSPEISATEGPEAATQDPGEERRRYEEIKPATEVGDERRQKTADEASTVHDGQGIEGSC